MRMPMPLAKLLAAVLLLSGLDSQGTGSMGVAESPRVPLERLFS